MEKRPRRFSLDEALFEGIALAARGLSEHEAIMGRWVRLEPTRSETGDLACGVPQRRENAEATA